jgi:hypothetical protein
VGKIAVKICSMLGRLKFCTSPCTPSEELRGVVAEMIDADFSGTDIVPALLEQTR